MNSVYERKAECYGCSACLNICPTSAIHMEQDEEGFHYPMINQQKCIDCKQCVKVCPFHQTLKETQDKSDFCQRYFAVQHKDRDIVKKSSSGGMFTALSKYILSYNGVVYGVAFDKAFTVRHKRAENEKICSTFMGSKYVQSNMDTIYQTLLDDLSKERLVLFTGTPCQIAGVRNFVLRQRHTLANLILCDFICHGVASPKIWASYIDYFKEKYKGGLTYFEFRGKKNGWHKSKPVLHANGVDISERYIKKKSFFLLYQTCFLNRPSCYSCKYTSYNRCSDITLGDFWNVGAVCPEMDDDTGTSQVLVNTLNGQKWFELCCDSLKFEECNKKDVWQPHLEYPTNANINKRDQFWFLYHTVPFEKVLNKYGQGDIIAKCKNFAVPLVKKLGLYVLMGKIYRFIFVRKAN